MSLSLKAQLEALAKKTPKLSETRKASILFNEKELESIDTETVFNIATNGLLKLIQIDGRFAQFQSTLFTRHSLNFNRELQTEEENKALNKNINLFLKLISSHLMTKEASKVLEYMIRKYKFVQSPFQL
jgi:U3 small nucleolar RNA-associated protein 10